MLQGSGNIACDGKAEELISAKICETEEVIEREREGRKARIRGVYL